MEGIQGIMQKLGLETTFSQMTPKEYEQYKVDSMNNAIGNRNEVDGYNCDICKNKGYIIKLETTAAGGTYQVSVDCKCAEIRRSIMRMRRSGLKNIIQDYTFSKFDTAEPWQKKVKEAAQQYAKEAAGWFFLGGQSGSGKTHLCTAICRDLLLEGKRVMYMMWRDDVAQIKASAMDSEERSGLVDKFKKAEVLYIDDLFKTGKNSEGIAQRPTVADINLAFEILNYRYNNPDLLTIISSECTEDDLLDIDEAVGGRIIEKAQAISIAKERKRNYRLRRAVTI